MREIALDDEDLIIYNSGIQHFNPSAFQLAPLADRAVLLILHETEPAQ